MTASQVEYLRRLKESERRSGKIDVSKNHKKTNRALRLCVTSGKGGVGKSNFALNVAISLTSLKQKVLLIDADTNLANLDILIGLHSKHNLSDVITGDKFIKDIIVEGPGGIDILPGSSGVLEMVELNSQAQQQLVESFRNLEKDYNFIIIDTGAGLTRHIVNFVVSSDQVVVITNSELTAISDAYAMIKVVSYHNPLLRIRLLVNMVDSRERAKQVFDNLNMVVQNFLSISLEYLGYLPNDSSVSAAVARQSPFVLEFPRSPASMTLKIISRKLLLGKNQRSSSGDDSLLSNVIKPETDK